MDKFTGTITNITTTAGTTTLRDLTYQYDITNNLTSKMDSITNSSETYSYDTNDRLIGWNYTNQHNQNIQRAYEFDINNNLTAITNNYPNSTNTSHPPNPNNTQC